MSRIKSKPSIDVSIKISVYANCDDVQLCWRTIDSNGKDIPINECLGFMIERKRKIDGKWSKPEILRNRVGFGDEPVDPANPKETTRPSNIWPFQRYDWTDHGANNSDEIQYRISALKAQQAGIVDERPLDILCSSEWTNNITISSKVENDIEVYFNRGTMMSQYVARYARERNWSAVDIKKNIKELNEPLRIFLSGELRLSMIRILDQVIANPFLSIYCILFELADLELIGKLKKISGRANIILSDGANSKKEKGKPVKYIDENETVRKDLKKAGVVVCDRILGKAGLGHNKILVVVDNRTDEPQLVFTGSTNWTSSGLCTQLNNAIVLKKKKVAEKYLEYWNTLRDAGSEFGNDLLNFNGKTPHIIGDTEIWFTRTKKPDKNEGLPDIEYIKALIDGAKYSIQYIMFQPGDEPLTFILKKRADEEIYIRGVVSTVIGSNQEKFTILDETMGMHYKTDLIQPNGIGKDISYWIKEVTRSGFIPSVGYAITHTKMIVIDAFGDSPIVITGSHNFSKSASQKNDENFVVIKGNKKLAEHYAVACASMYAHYRYRAYLMDKLTAKGNFWSHLEKDPVWQNSRLSSKRTLKHLKFWCP